jgi:hypothetical protein
MERILAAALMLAGAAGVPPEGPQTGLVGDGTLLFFFSPDTSSAPAAATTLSKLAKAKEGKIRVRPVLLVEDWKTFRSATEESPLYRTVRELGGRGDPPGVPIPIFDEDGLRLARAWSLSRLPAFVLISHGKAHLVYGSRVTLEDLLECRK